MRSRTKGGTWRTPANAVAILVVAVLVVLGPDPRVATADEVDTGTIYFYYSDHGQMYRMNPDGSGKSAVDADVDDFCEPSYLPHDGRWFLQVDLVGDETYPDGWDSPKPYIRIVRQPS